MSLLPTIDHKIIEIVPIEWYAIVIFYVNGSFCEFINELGVWHAFVILFFFQLFYFILRFTEKNVSVSCVKALY